MSADSETKSSVARVTTLVSVAVNTLLVILQIGVGVFAQSQALIADGIHSLSDVLSDGIVLVANRHGAADPDPDHQYGHSRYETVASLFIGALLVLVGAGMLWRAVSRFVDPGQIPPVHGSALLVAVLVIGAKEGLFRYMLRRAEAVRSSMLVANAWHARSDAASSLVVALGVGGSLLGFPLFDPLAAAVVGVMIGGMGMRFAWNALQDLSDRALEAGDIEALKRLVADTPGVRDVHALRTRKMGDLAVVDAHVLVEPMISVSEGHYIAESARAALTADARVLDALIHVDPESDELMRLGEGEPQRAVLESTARRLFEAHGLKFLRLDIHYLSSGLVVDLYLDAREHACHDVRPDPLELAHALQVPRVRVYGLIAD